MDIYANPKNDWTKDKAQYLYDNLETLLTSIFTMAGLDLDADTEGVQTSLEDLIGGLVNGLIADADLANLIMNALVPVLSGLDIDAILKYVTNNQFCTNFVKVFNFRRPKWQKQSIGAPFAPSN